MTLFGEGAASLACCVYEGPPAPQPPESDLEAALVFLLGREGCPTVSSFRFLAMLKKTGTQKKDRVYKMYIDPNVTLYIESVTWRYRNV